MMNYITNWWTDNNKLIQQISEPQINQVIANSMELDSIPGLVILIVFRGQVLFSKGYGIANLELQVPVNEKTMFQSGSVGKMFTAAGVMILVEDGKVDLEDSILCYLSEGPEIWREITLRHLMTHTSGIPDYDPKMLNYHQNYTSIDLIHFAQGLQLSFQPGTKWSYSNTGYILLGIIISRVSGDHYWKLLENRIWKPSKMPDVCINHINKIVNSRAAGYLVNTNHHHHLDQNTNHHLDQNTNQNTNQHTYEFDGKYRNQDWVSPTLNTTADGSLLLSLRDLIAWNQVVRTRTVLSQKSWQEILSPVKLQDGKTYPYGFGWFLDKIHNYSVHEHSGGWQGFRTYFRRYQDLDLAIAVLANSCCANTKKITDSIAELLNPNLVIQEEKEKEHLDNE